MKAVTRDQVFVAGGQPDVTYVDRTNAGISGDLHRAIEAPNQIVSLAGPSKSGKTVLCRHVLSEKPYVWINGGEVRSADALWPKLCSELNFPIERKVSEGSQTSISAAIKGMIFSASGSQLETSELQRVFKIDSIEAATKHLCERKIALIIDDFHYLSDDARREFIRNIKGSVYNGLKVILLAVPHRVFDALKAEEELIGRFESVTIPEWTDGELGQIYKAGFAALNIKPTKALGKKLVAECQFSPFLMQKLCWEICYEMGVDSTLPKVKSVPSKVTLESILKRLSKDAGRVTYDALRGGPQIRKDRKKRPLKSGGEADVYEIVLRGLAETGPMPEVKYGELRESIERLVKDQVPQGNEVTSVLKHLAEISQQRGQNAGIDWDETGRIVSISDPYFRLFLRWQVRQH